MEKNIYYYIESEIKKNKYFGRDNLPYDIAIILAYIATLASTFLIIKKPIIGWSLTATIFIVYLICNILAPGFVVYRYFRIKQNRETIKMLLTENNNSFFQKLDFTKPLKVRYIFRIFKMLELLKLIRKTCPTIVDIIKKHGIYTKETLKEAIEHYRFQVATSKELNIKVLPILSIILTIIASLYKDSLAGVASMLIAAIFAFSIYIIIMILKSKFIAPYSQKTLYKNIELVLSEIYISNEFDKHKTQFGFPSHLQ